MIPSGVSYSVWLFVPLFWLFSLIFIYPKPPTLEASFQIPPLLSNSQHLRLTRHLGVVFGDQQPFTDGFSIEGKLDPFSCWWRGC